MNEITDSKLVHNLDRVNGDFRPITADVFLTNYCNNKCSWCTYNRWELDKGAYSMPYDDFSRYAVRLISLGVRGIILTGGGEPTINRDFDKITAFLERKGVPYGINTNFNVLRYCSPEYLKVSLDGYSESSYEKIRNVKAYEKVRENIIAYAEWKKVNSPKTRLGIQMVVTDPYDVIRFYDGNRDLPVDYIVYRPLESTHGEHYGNYENMEEAKKAVRIIQLLAEKDERVVLNFKWDLLSVEFDSCVAHWAQIAIDERGNVMYCCHKPYEIVGHILDPDIMEKHNAARTDMKLCDIPCRLTAPNMFMQKVSRDSTNSMFI